VLAVEAGPFTQVGVVLSQERVRRIEFSLREDSFLLGDLMLRAGLPEQQRRNSPYYYAWAGDSLLAGSNQPSPYDSPFLPLRNISFTVAGWRILSDR
jgi:hypothetical protein